MVGVAEVATVAAVTAAAAVASSVAGSVAGLAVESVVVMAEGMGASRVAEGSGERLAGGAAKEVRGAMGGVIAECRYSSLESGTCKMTGTTKLWLSPRLDNPFE